MLVLHLLQRDVGGAGSTSRGGKDNFTYCDAMNEDRA